ncbi:MAG: aminopeptidase P family protein [Bacteroidales bacterium]|jgi:Xaa-Pro aminopeptidase|nr:aminopeptidase P family protein [Bacteroidales bacterium]
MNEIKNRLKALRLEMLKQNLDAFYISGTDPHSNEYLPEKWKICEFLTGFTGSCGIVAITQEDAGLWTDSRYFIQAEEQLKGSGVKMFKMGVTGAISPEKWLSEKLKPKSKVGFEPQALTVNGFRILHRELDTQEIVLVKTTGLLDKVWENRPETPCSSVYDFPLKYAGVSRKEKWEQQAAELKKTGACFNIISTLDELAWMFNLRGNAVNCSPVFTGYGVIGENEMLLFTNKSGIGPQLLAQLEKEKISVHEYGDFFAWLNETGATGGTKIFIDPSTLNYSVFEILEKNGNSFIEGASPVKLQKARKNTVELNGFRSAMIKDGAAMVEFLYWIRQNIGKGNITEYTVGRKLDEIRSKQPGYDCESFPPIVGYKNHGAIVHLSVDANNALPLEPRGLLLIDSGGQYKDGTTDITRTIALGEVTDQQKIDFTLVLKGMIALTAAVFPVGTKGCQLDILARKPLLEKGLNYGHGTGHGVGHFLNVHEGPVAIRPDFNPNPIEPGMVFSNEPAIYRSRLYGIRTENMIVCVEKEENEFGKFLCFETLTLCPVDTSLIDFELLTPNEKEWLNTYHLRVKNELTHCLSKEHRLFLAEITKPV